MYVYFFIACITFLNIFFYYTGICVLDPAVVYHSSCTNGIKPLSYNKSRANKWKAVGDDIIPKLLFQANNSSSAFTHSPRTDVPLAFLCGAPYPSNPCCTRPAPATCWH